MFWKKFLGLFGEDEAAKFLKRNGYKIIERNYKCRYGEIDIIARQKDTWCFIEVKTIQKAASESPFETIDKKKMEHIENSAACYVSKNKLGREKVRFDAIGIRVSEGKSEIELIKDLF
jgi:putative endonuclease